MRGITIGLSVSTAATPGADPVAAAREAEDLGFDFVSASDHLHGRQPTWETWTMLSWIAAATSHIKVATRVLGVPYRPPAVLAKMAETFDRLSDGRLILGLGGGAVDEEFRAFGFPVRSPRDKVDGLEEAIRIARGLWSRPGFTFEGRLYRTDGADLEPKPERRIPIWLGTYGNRALALTGRLVDGWIPSLGYAHRSGSDRCASACWPPPARPAVTPAGSPAPTTWACAWTNAPRRGRRWSRAPPAPSPSGCSASGSSASTP
jgi:alkanesulfonate monooxygenase SsuD/methylene tetrahydromethanopterin reductase-like flavin-dependent oxidoreductase (luciferase family)